MQRDIVRIVEADGTVVATYKYDPWGKVISATGTMASVNPLRYRGYYFDSETGFYYLMSRYYDPEIGRFINADIFTSTGQGIVGNNMFAYCLNNPVIHADHSGLSTRDKIVTPFFILIIMDDACGSGPGGGTGGGIGPIAILIAVLDALTQAVRYSSYTSKKDDDKSVYYVWYGPLWRN